MRRPGKTRTGLEKFKSAVLPSFVFIREQWAHISVVLPPISVLANPLGMLPSLPVEN